MWLLWPKSGLLRSLSYLRAYLRCYVEFMGFGEPGNGKAWPNPYLRRPLEQESLRAQSNSGQTALAHSDALWSSLVSEN